MVLGYLKEGNTPLVTQLFGDESFSHSTRVMFSGGQSTSFYEHTGSFYLTSLVDWTGHCDNPLDVLSVANP